MLLIAKDRSYTTEDTYDITAEEAEAQNCYLIEDKDLEERIIYAYPEFEFVIENGEVVDITTDKVKPPTIEEQVAELQAENVALQEQNQMLTDCILEMSEVVYA